MGYAVPAAMGAKVGRPDATVWAIDGDGCFQMTNQELATCAINDIPIKVALINNSSLGMVRQWQTLFYESRYSNTDLHSHRIPDFVKLADAYGCVGLRCESPERRRRHDREGDGDQRRAGRRRLRGPPDAMVWPMVAAGTSNDDIKVARDLGPALGPRGLRSPVMSRHTLSVLVEDQPGVLARISALFSRRGFNIDSPRRRPDRAVRRSRA